MMSDKSIYLTNVSCPCAAENTSALGTERQHFQHRARQDNERVSYISGALEISDLNQSPPSKACSEAKRMS